MSLDQCLSCEHSCIGCTVDCTFWEGPCASYIPDHDTKTKQDFYDWLVKQVYDSTARELQLYEEDWGSEDWFSEATKTSIYETVLKKAKELMGELD